MFKLQFIIAIIAINIMATYQQCANPYTVKTGDSCWSIWASAKLTDAQFYSYNPGLDCSGLMVGKVVCLSAPFAGNSAVQILPLHPSCSNTYKLQPDDLCWSIMGKYDIDPNTFLTLNPGLDCNNLITGQLVCVGYLAQSTVSTAPPTTTTARPTTTLAPTTSTITTTATPTIGPVFTTVPPTFSAIITDNTLTNGQNTNGQNTNGENTNGQNTNGQNTNGPIVTDGTVTNFPTGFTAPYGCLWPYSVRQGDTCWSMSNQLTSLGNKFYLANPGINCNFLQIGQIVCLDDCSFKKYQVQPGDYCWLIMTNNGLTQDQFYRLNPALDCNRLLPGQFVYVGYSQWC